MSRVYNKNKQSVSRDGEGEEQQEVEGNQRKAIK